MRLYAKNRATQGKFINSLVERGIIAPDTVIAAGGAGALPYFADLKTVDRRGLNDHYIARLPVKERGVVAHELDAPYEYFEERKVVMFDILNRLVHNDDRRVGRGKKYYHDGREANMRAFKIDGRYVVFATFVSDQELQEKITGVKIIGLNQKPDQPQDLDLE